MTFVIALSTYLAHHVAPKSGHINPIVYVTICSGLGSLSVMAVKAVGIALKLTVSGHNQFASFSTYAAIAIMAVCIVLQMKYLNKALQIFPTSVINPLYFVCFTSATIVASFIMLGGLRNSTPDKALSLLGGFAAMFAGVSLLKEPESDKEPTAYTDSAAYADPPDRQQYEALRTPVSPTAMLSPPSYIPLTPRR